MFWFRKKKLKKKKLPRGEERRKEPRLEDLNELTVEPRQPEKLGIPKRSYFARTRDASPSGLRVECEVRFPVDTELNIRLQSPKTGKMIQAAGVVKWVAKLKEREVFEIGLEFIDTPIKTILNLLEHIYKA
jgi:hypothetical protein